MSNDLTWVVASDIHFPLHDKRKVDLLMKVIKKLQPDAVDLAGDIDNADSTSRWADGTTDEYSPIEDEGVSDTRNFLAELRGMLPDADLHLHDGNHGWTRHESYIDKKAPTLRNFITADTLYEYTKSGWHFHRWDHPPVHRFGDMYVHHGESISKHAGESVRNDILNWDVSLIRGHSHRMGTYNKTFNLTGRKLRGYEIGHLMNEDKADYLIGKDWQPGFLVATVENGEYPHCQLVHINNYTCYVDGRKFAS